MDILKVPGWVGNLLEVIHDLKVVNNIHFREAHVTVSHTI